MPGRTESDARSTGNTGGPELSRPIDGLTFAIDALENACRRLESSVDGVNTGLEDANCRLAEALNVRSETAAYLESVLAGLPVGVVVVDRDGCVALLNRAAEAITGLSAGEVTGQKYCDTLGKNVSFKQTPLYTLATGSELHQKEKTLIAKSGETVPVSISTSLIGSEGSLVGAIEVIVDLRRMKALEEEVDRVRTLAAIGELAAAVAHEIRNPLGGIKGFVSLLERDLRADAGSLVLLGRIRGGIESLEAVVDDLLEAGKRTKLSFSHADLTREVARAVEMCEMAARGEGKHIDFEVLTPAPPVYCRVDTQRVRQAVTNLVRNAVEVSRDGGRVTVRLQTGGCADGGSSGADQSKDYLSIKVMDDGEGVPPDLTEKIFTPFFTTKRGGTGLGLHNVRTIAGLHGGKVEYSLRASGGSTFTMTIPRW